MELIGGILLSIALISVAIILAGPHAVEQGMRRALRDEFLRPKSAEPLSEPVSCLKCGAQMTPGDTSCGECGWTYAANGEDA